LLLQLLQPAVLGIQSMTSQMLPLPLNEMHLLVRSSTLLLLKQLLLLLLRLN
jgi:hypothetical protein